MPLRKVGGEFNLWSGLEAVGGKENIVAAAHCATRLRLVLKDEGNVNQGKLDNMDAVKGTFSTGGDMLEILRFGKIQENTT